jgi:hypothetical protein
MTQDKLKTLIEDLHLNHEYCPKEVILQAADELERLAQRTEPPAWFPAVENILNEYGLQAIDFVADFKAAMKDAEQPQHTWVGLASEDRLTAKYMQDAPDGIEAVIDYIEAKLKQKNGYAEENT